MASARRRRVTDELDRTIERSVRRLQLRSYQALTSATPVRTGFARAGWSPSVGAPRPGPDLPARRPGLGAQAQESAARTQAAALFAEHSQAAAALAGGYRLTQGPVFIANNVRYIVPLNMGSSAQAPAMFVEQAIAVAVAQTQAELT